MNANEARELRAQRKKLCEDANVVLANKALTPQERNSQFDRMMAEADDLRGQIERIERVGAAMDETRGGAPPASAITGADDPETFKKAQARHYQAWKNYMKFGATPRMTQNNVLIKGMPAEDRQILFANGGSPGRGGDDAMVSNELRLLDTGARERRDMGSGGQGAYPGATTGFFVPVGFVDKIEEALKYYGPMMRGGARMPDIFDTDTGQVLPYPTDNDTTISGELIGENTQVTAQDVSLGQIVFGAWKFSSRLVKVSIELLQDSAFDFESFLVRKFGTRLGRVINTYMTTGNGTQQPNGIVTASTFGVTFVGSGSNDGTGVAATSIGSDDLINLEHSVDPLYRPNAMYMMHDSTLRQIKTLKDKYGRPLWLPGLALMQPDTILQYPYAINNDMAAIQTVTSSPVVTNKTILFGDIGKYMIRRVRDMSILRLEERFADYGQVAFLAFWRGDGQLLDAGTHPVRYGQNVG